jgi:zinc/manganese transport system substrate-binding protein
MRHRIPARPKRSRSRTLAAAIVAGLVLAACAADDASEVAEAEVAGPAPAVELVRVVATTSILGDLVANILGDDGTVVVLIGAGLDPHAYQASARDAAALRDADLVIANGLLLEEGLLAALDAAESDGVRILTVADKLDPIEFGTGHAHHDDHGDDDHGDDEHSHGHSHGHSHEDDEDDEDAEHADDEHADEHDHGDEDPHFWWDPIRTATAVELIAAELGAVRPDIDWSARADAYVLRILEVHEEMQVLFDAIPEERRRIITNHDSLGYLEARYGFEVIGTVIPGSSTTVATSARDFAALVDLMVDEGVSVVFAENTDSLTLAQQLASEAIGRSDLDVSVVRILTDALGEPGSGADTYLGLLRVTAGLIHAALVA